MKKVQYLLVLVMLAMSFISKSQSIEITPQGGFAFESTYYDGYNHIRFNQNAIYGGGFYFRFNELSEVGIVVMQQSTTADAYNYVSDTIGVKVGITNFHLQGNRAIDPLGSGKFLPYAGLGIGGSYFYVREGGPSRMKFSINLQAGTRFQITNNLGIRIQGNLLFPVSGVGLGFGFGTGGVSVGAGANSAMIQFGLTAGIGFTFGNSYE